LNDQKRDPQTNRHHPVPHRRVDLAGILLQRVVDAGIDNQDLDRAELALNRRDDRSGRLDVGHVAGERGRPTTQRLDLGCDLLGRLSVRAIRDGDVVPVLCQAHRGRGADAARASGDKRHGVDLASIAHPGSRDVSFDPDGDARAEAGLPQSDVARSSIFPSATRAS
jgi:hypothetical protein